MEGLNKKNTKHVVIEINDDDVKTEETPPKQTVSVSSPAIIEPIKTVIESAEPPTNQNDIITDSYEDEDNDDFDPDDTELV